MLRLPAHCILFAILWSAAFAQGGAWDVPQEPIWLPPAQRTVDAQGALSIDLPGVEWQGQPVECWVVPETVKAPEFQLYAWGVSRGMLALGDQGVATWTGTVRGVPQAVVLATLAPSGWRARIEWPDGEVWRLEPDLQAGNGWHRLQTLANDLEGGEWSCGTDFEAELLESAKAAYESTSSSRAFGAGMGAQTVPPCGATRLGSSIDVGSALVPNCMFVAQIAFDADFEYYTQQGSSVANVEAAILQILLEVNYFYARDVQIEHSLTAIVVRTSPFYAPTGGGDLLQLFRAEWNTNLVSIPRDMAHLMTNKTGIDYLGLAYVGVVCGTSAYGWSKGGANVVGHEVGHNWSSSHCHDTSPCNNMCGACFNIGPNTQAIIAAFRNSRTCLDNARGYNIPVPPYLRPDPIPMLNKSAWPTAAPYVWDPLANDHDGNCDPLRIAGFDAVTPRGGSVERLIGQGAGGSDALQYTAPLVPFVGEDVVHYSVADHHGMQTAGELRVRSEAEHLMGYWSFDAGQGDTVSDESGYHSEGLGALPISWVPGHFGSAMAFPGNGQALLNSGVSFAGDWTYAVWVRRLPGTSTTESLIEAENGSLRLNQAGATDNVGVTGPGGANSSYGVSAPLGIWTHLAFVGTNQGTALYQNGSFVGQVSNQILAPRGSMGWGGTLFAHIDDARLYDYALAPSELQTLANLGGRAHNPEPADATHLAESDGWLRWVGTGAATSYQVYVGNNATLVANANGASPEFQGSTHTRQWSPTGLVYGQQAFWRVDTVTDLGTAHGDVWSLTLPAQHRWTLDDANANLAVDSRGSLDGSYLGGTLLQQPGATPHSGNSVHLDGLDDRVALPALQLNDNHLTITCWLRREGNQNPFAGLVFSRAGSTVAGLGFGDHQELRYHWNGTGASYNFDSGLLVPDNVWVFAACVIEPDQATLYLHDGQTLQSSRQATSHEAEAFDGTLLLGRDSNSSARSFRGWLDDVRVYRGALPQSEILRVYESAL